MIKSPKSSRYGKQAAFIIGFLFILLGSSTQAETSWLFTLAGVIAIIQGLYLRSNEGKK